MITRNRVHLTFRSSNTKGPFFLNASTRLTTLGYRDAIPYAMGSVTRTTCWSIFTYVSSLSSPVLTWPTSMQKEASMLLRCILVYISELRLSRCRVDILVRYGGNVLRETGDPLCTLCRRHCMVDHAPVNDLKP